jgi:hypothetical protein
MLEMPRLSSTGRFSDRGSATLAGLLGLLLCCCGFFSLAPARQPAFLVPVVRTGFQFVVLTGVAEEVEDRLSIFGHDLLLSGRTPVALLSIEFIDRGFAGRHRAFAIARGDKVVNRRRVNNHRIIRDHNL